MSVWGAGLKVRIGAAALAAVLSIGWVEASIGGSQCYAQAAVKAGLEGTWQGTLHAGKDLRCVVKITKAPDGSLKAVFYSIDQGAGSIPIKTASLDGSDVRLDVDAIGGVYKGRMSADGNSITGEWKQGDQPLPMVLVRATAETAWTIPEPPPKMAPMAKDADPSFDVATIKPSDPSRPGKGFGGPPGHFMTINTTLDDLIMFAYQVHTKQVAGGPDWVGVDKFDIQAKPDTPGAASSEQNRVMMRKLLAERFGLKFHHEKREMSAFVLTVAKGGPKLEKSSSDADAPIGFNFSALGNLHFANITMHDFASWMQTVLDRPMVDQTGLEGRFTGGLKWNPDETQFAIFGPPPHPSTADDAPPPLPIAIGQQLGLKIDAAKTPVDVMVIDHVEKPSAN